MLRKVGRSVVLMTKWWWRATVASWVVIGFGWWLDLASDRFRVAPNWDVWHGFVRFIEAGLNGYTKYWRLIKDYFL